MANGLFNLKQVMQAVQQGGWPAQKTPAVEYLVVAGGGGGGATNSGGGGAGGLLQGIDPVPNGQTLLVTIGGGGAGSVYSGGWVSNPIAGQNSVFGSISATGGGAGGPQSSGTIAEGGTGGSGGGAGTFGVFSANNVSGQGNAGGFGGDNNQWTGSGGGGAGTVGLNAGTGASASTNGGNGGAGIASAISGTVTTYAGGGGGGGRYSGGYSTGGVGGGGGGNGGVAPYSGVNGSPNTGGGGGGGGVGGATATGGTGGSGVVIVSYPDVYAAATTVNATVSTSGSGSINCAGSSACFYYGGQSGFAFGTGDFTLEMWLNPNASAQNEFYDSRPSGGGAGTQYPVLYANAGKIFFFSNGSDLITGTTTLVTGTWYHIAVCRSGTVTKMFLNGVQEGSSYTDTNNYAIGSSRPVVMGNGSGTPGGTVFNGKISNLRVVKGTALYTSAFTPSTIPFTAVTNTQLLLNSVSGAYLADGSTNSFVASIAGAPVWNSASPFTGTGYKNRVYTWTSSGSITF